MSKNKKNILTAILLATLIILARFLSIKTPILTISFAFIPTMLSAIWLGAKRTIILNVLADIARVNQIEEALIAKGYNNE